MNSLITYELDGEVALIGLNRADKRNALNIDLVLQLKDAVERAIDEAKAAVIHGHGDHFSAGLDLAEAAARIRPGAPRPQRGRWHPTFELIARSGLPFVAALQGACVGGGLELASSCHIRVADESTFFALPEGQRGIFVGGGGSVNVQRLLGYARMADLMLTGRVLSAADGERLNLCQYVVERGKALETATLLAQKISGNAPRTNWAVCAALPRVNDLSHEDGLFVEKLIVESVSSPESFERTSAFVEKRAAPLQRPSSQEQ